MQLTTEIPMLRKKFFTLFLKLFNIDKGMKCTTAQLWTLFFFKFLFWMSQQSKSLLIQKWQKNSISRQMVGSFVLKSTYWPAAATIVTAHSKRLTLQNVALTCSIGETTATCGQGNSTQILLRSKKKNDDLVWNVTSPMSSKRDGGKLSQPSEIYR